MQHRIGPFHYEESPGYITGPDCFSETVGNPPAHARFVVAELPAWHQTNAFARAEHRTAIGHCLAAAPEMLAMLTQLLDWESYMGGWEAPIWREARDLHNRLGNSVCSASANPRAVAATLSNLLEYAEKFADMADEPEGGDCRESIADARKLIELGSASQADSDLLAALRNAANWIRSELNGRLYVEPLLRAEAAIAKAEGGK